MTKLLSLDQLDLLNKLYYIDGLMVGRDRLYKYVSTHHGDMNISRRQNLIATISNMQLKYTCTRFMN